MTRAGLWHIWLDDDDPAQESTLHPTSESRGNEQASLDLPRVILVYGCILCYCVYALYVIYAVYAYKNYSRPHYLLRYFEHR
jgi:hypothetical protein